jgi:hypothetical protein
MKDRKIKQFLYGSGCQWEGEGHKKRVKEGEYGFLNSCMKIE